MVEGPRRRLGRQQNTAGHAARKEICNDCYSMSEHMSGRLDHSPPRTSNEPNRVPMEEVVALTGRDSDADVNHDAHATALTFPHQIQPQQGMQASHAHAAETLC